MDVIFRAHLQGTVYLYPGYTPARIRIEDIRIRPLESEVIDSALEHGLSDWEQLTAEYREVRKDIFAPGSQPFLLRPEHCISENNGLFLCDAKGAGLFMPLTDEQTNHLRRNLSSARFVAVFGTLEAENGRLVFHPFSVITEKDLTKKLVCLS